MIELKHLYKSFPDKSVLEDINTVFENGKTNLIIGQSGSGKTVLMKCLVGLLEPSQGEVLYTTVATLCICPSASGPSSAAKWA